MFFFFFSQTPEWNNFRKQVLDQLKYKTNRLLYHYTSPEGLIGILSNNRLWFTESSCLNDESEGRYIYSIIQDCINNTQLFDAEFVDEIKKRITDSKLDHKEISSPLIEDKKHREIYEEAKSKYFICSFSHDKDALPLWNYYTKTPTSIGYNIAFSSTKLNKSIEGGLKNFTNRYFYKVIYDEKIQKSIIMNALEIGNRLWKQHQDELYKYDLIFWLEDFFEHIKFGFKHPAFESEKEVRMILRMSSPKFEELIVHNSSLAYNEIKIRTIKGVFVPYVEMSYDKSAVNGIMVSPTVKDELAVESLNLLLKKYSYTDCRIEKSSVPLKY